MHAQKLCCSCTSAATKGVVKGILDPLILVVIGWLTEATDDMPSCFLVQRTEHIVVLGGVGIDLAYVELCFGLFKPYMGLCSPESGQIE